jgi:hypothetical protein
MAVALLREVPALGVNRLAPCPSSGGDRKPRAISFDGVLGARPADIRAPRFSIQAGASADVGFLPFPAHLVSLLSGDDG